MDGRGRLVEPVTDGANARPVVGTTPAPRRTRARKKKRVIKLPLFLHRWAGPLSSIHIPRFAGVAATALFLLGSIGYGTVRGEHIPEFVAGLRDARDGVANLFGFRITSIALAGQRQVTREEVLTTAGVTGRTSLLFLDAADVRAKLKSNPWISEATVLKLYPGRLHISVTEREAFALWQKSGKVSVISGDGTVVEPFVARRFANLPLVVGAGAETRAKEFLAILDKYPQVRDQMRAGVLVAERRWNLKLKNGIDIRLPENDVGQALDMLTKLDREKKLLTRDIAAIDMRLPDRVTVRLSDEAAAAREELFKDKKPKKKGGDA
ncbi:MAG: cell division protein FtsQ/DivIB [Pseudomonadota bacterium]